jgi:hypothetical protein
MTEEFSIDDLFACHCEYKYSIEPHGGGYVLYYGRCGHRHGDNLVNMIEPAWNFDPVQITRLLNLGLKEYWESGRWEK